MEVSHVAILHVISEHQLDAAADLTGNDCDGAKLQQGGQVVRRHVSRSGDAQSQIYNHAILFTNTVVPCIMNVIRSTPMVIVRI